MGSQKVKIESRATFTVFLLYVVVGISVTCAYTANLICGSCNKFRGLKGELENGPSESGSQRGMICLFLDACVSACSVVSVVYNSLRPHGLYSARLLCPWGSSRQEHWSVLPFSSPLFPHNMYLKHLDFSSSHMMSCTSACIPLGKTQCQTVPLSAVGSQCDHQSLLDVEVHFSLLINKQSVADTLHD